MHARTHTHRQALAPLRHSGRSVAPLTTRTTALVNAVRLRAAPLASASRGALRKFSQGAGEETLQPYAPAARWLHWISGLGMIGCVGLVLKAQDYPAWDKCTPEEGAAKGSLMFYHKSMGLTMLGAAIPRVLIALVSKRPPAPAGPAIIKIGGHVSHLAMYALVIIMPVTGFVMGYMGPKGLPFWFTTLNPGSGEIGKAKNGPMAVSWFQGACGAGEFMWRLDCYP